MFIQALQNSHLFLPASFAQRGVGVCPCVSGDKHLLPPAHRKEKLHTRKQRSKTLLCSLQGVASAAFSAHKVLYGAFVPKFPFWASKPPYACTKPLLKIVQRRLRFFFPFWVELTYLLRPYLLLVLYRWLNDLSAKCILSAFQAFHAEMNTRKNGIFANSVDYSFVSG